jgi:hypothetical protein
LQALRDHIADGTNLTEAGGTGDHLTAVAWNSAWDAEVQSEVQDAIEANHLDHLLAADYDPASPPGTATALLNELIESDSGVSRFTANALEQAPSGGGSAPTASEVADAVWDEALSGHTTAGTAGERIGRIPNAAAGGNGGLPTVDANNYIAGQQGTINTLDALDTAQDSQHSTTQSSISGLNDLSAAQVNSEVDTAIADAGLDHLVSAAVTGTDVTDNSIVARLVSASATADWDDFANTTDSLQALRDRGDAAWITGNTTTPPTAAAIRTEIDSNSTQLADIVADTNELQTDWANGGRLDSILDARASQTTADAIETDTQDIQSRIPASLSSGRMVTDVEAINANTAAAIRLALSAGQIIPFTVDTATNSHTPTNTEFQADDVTEATDDHFNGRVVLFTSGALAGQATSISDYTTAGGIGQFTVVAITEAPANNDTGIII